MAGPVICPVFVGRARDLEALHAVLNRVRRGSSQTVLLSGEAFSVVEHSLKPGAATPPHTHAHEDEYSYVLEGKIGARIGDKVVEATPGM